MNRKLWPIVVLMAFVSIFGCMPRPAPTSIGRSTSSPALVPQAMTLEANKLTLTAAPANAITAVFDAWLTEARSAFANFGGGPQSIVDDYHCQNQEIGDGISTEPACTGYRLLAIKEKQISIQVDWSISNPERWHADMTLDIPLSVKCQEIQSSVEYHRAQNEFAELVACRTQADDEVLIVVTSDNITLAYLSADFVRAYPGYVSSIVQSTESSP